MRLWGAPAAIFFVLHIAAAFSQGLSVSQGPSVGGDGLSFRNTLETLDQRCNELPAWRKGGVQVDAPVMPLSAPSFSWAAGYIWNHPLAGHPSPWPQPLKDFPAWTSNLSADASPNGDMIRRMDKKLVPLTWSETLNFTVQEMPPELASTVGNEDPKQYIGATINSFPFAQKYGVFAMSAKLPGGKGIWPAFWLLPADKSWPPEIDVMEVIGIQPSTLYTSVHTNIPGRETAYGQGTDTHLDLSAAFHEYAVDWGPERIDWYFDRKLVYSQPTPPDLHNPCYIIANVGVGKPNGWGGAPDASTHFPAIMQVAYIKAWQRPEYLGR
jgi:Glycosyl hydrolases family 16